MRQLRKIIKSRSFSGGASALTFENNPDGTISGTICMNGSVFVGTPCPPETTKQDMATLTAYEFLVKLSTDPQKYNCHGTTAENPNGAQHMLTKVRETLCQLDAHLYDESLNNVVPIVNLQLIESAHNDNDATDYSETLHRVCGQSSPSGFTKKTLNLFYGKCYVRNTFEYFGDITTCPNQAKESVLSLLLDDLEVRPDKFLLPEIQENDNSVVSKLLHDNNNSKGKTILYELFRHPDVVRIHGNVTITCTAEEFESSGGFRGEARVETTQNGGAVFRRFGKVMGTKKAAEQSAAAGMMLDVWCFPGAYLLSRDFCARWFRQKQKYWR